MCALWPRADFSEIAVPSTMANDSGICPECIELESPTRREQAERIREILRLRNSGQIS